MDIPDTYKILDNRIAKNFKTTTISNFLKKDVLSAFQKSLMTGKIEDACNWALELLCSGHLNNVYDKFFIFIVKYININNPDLIIIFYNRYAVYRKIKNLLKNDILRMRNFQNIRNHIGELCAAICLSTKSKIPASVKITNDHFNTEFIKSKFQADRDNYIESYCRFGDPEELKIMLNEFIYHLNKYNYECALYWIGWLCEWEKINIKKGKEYKCGYRNIEGVENKYLTNMDWAIWEILINLKADKYIDALFQLYVLDYKDSQKGKKFPLILFAIRIYTDSHKVVNQNIYSINLPTIIQVCANINNLMVEKKKHEINNLKESQEKIHQANYLGHTEVMKKEMEKKRGKNKVNIDTQKKIMTMEELDTLFLQQATR